jgi:hypothetical protein
MSIKYIVLSETNHYGWVGGFTTLAEAKKMLKIETETFYIFKYVHEKTKPFQMKIRFPIIAPYYDGLTINEYKDEVFAFKGVSGDFLKVEPIGIITEEVYKDYVPAMKRFMKSTKESFFSIHDHKFQLISLCVVNDSFNLV